MPITATRPEFKDWPTINAKKRLDEFRRQDWYIRAAVAVVIFVGITWYQWLGERHNIKSKDGWGSALMAASFGTLIVSGWITDTLNERRKAKGLLNSPSDNIFLSNRDALELIDWAKRHRAIRQLESSVLVLGKPTYATVDAVIADVQNNVAAEVRASMRI